MKKDEDIDFKFLLENAALFQSVWQLYDREMADLFGYSRIKYVSIKKGYVTPSIAFLVRLAALSGADMGALLTRELELREIGKTPRRKPK